MEPFQIFSVLVLLSSHNKPSTLVDGSEMLDMFRPAKVALWESLIDAFPPILIAIGYLQGYKVIYNQFDLTLVNEPLII